MPKYRVTVTERVTYHEMELDVESAEEAEEIAEYRMCEGEEPDVLGVERDFLIVEAA